MTDRVTHLVVIVREGTAEVTGFTSYDEATHYFDTASLNWTESYLTCVVFGPGRPMVSPPIDPHMRPDIVARRLANKDGWCIDNECDLSGGHAHAGECLPCKCPLRHAAYECPEEW